MVNSPEIKTIKAKKLVGQSINMSLIDNKTYALFSGFMPKRKLIDNNVSEFIYELLVYDKLHFENFNPANTFIKWATVEVTDFNNVPKGMQTFTLNEGLYAIFKFVGTAKDFGAYMNYIFTQWLPQSNYILDTATHFNCIDPKYKQDDPNNVELVYIPIKLK